MRILVTGGAGLVGSHCAEFFALSNPRNKVIVLDNLMRSKIFGYDKASVEYNWNFLKKFKNVERIKGDVRNDRDVAKAIGRGVDVVIHTAGQPGVPSSVRIPKEDFSINAFGTLNVLEAARKKSKDTVFIYTSTNKVYGENVDKIPLIEKEKRYIYDGIKGVSEDMSADLTGHTPYGASKYCLPPGSIVITNNGIKKIEDIKENDIVLTHGGSFKKVIKLFKHKHKGEIYKISTLYGGDTYLTPEHPVLVSRKNRDYYNKYKVKNRRYLNVRRYGNKLESEELEWIQTKDLQKDYLVVFPRLKPKQTCLRIKIKDFLEDKKIKSDSDYIYYNQSSGKSVKIKNIISLNKDFMRLVGYYLSEGGVTIEKSAQVTFSFNADEKEYIKDAIKLINKFFGITPTVVRHNGSFQVCIKSKIMAMFFAKLLGHGAHNKFVPEFILNKPNCALIELLKGYWRGDGDFHPQNRKIRFSTCNYGLAIQTKLILGKIGIISSVFKIKRKDGFNPGSTKYSVEVTGLYNDLLVDLLGIDKNYKSKSKKRKSKGFVSARYIYYPIINIKSLGYNGYVYNFEVEDNHSYITENLTLHNCGDIYTQEYGHIYKMKTCVFRCSCIYGSRQFGFEDQGWVAWFIIATLFNRPITIYGNGKQVRDMLYVDDLVDAFNRFINSDLERGLFNIGGGPDNTISLLEFLDELKNLTGRSPKVNFSNWRPSDQKVYITDITKLEKILNWKIKTPVRQGIKKLLDWVKANKEYFS